MRVVLALTALLLISSTQANILDGFKESMEKAGKFFEETLGRAREEGEKLMEKAIAEAGENLKNAKDAIWDAFKEMIEGSILGKRSLGDFDLSALVNKIAAKGQEAMENAKEQLQKVYNNALDRFKTVVGKVLNMDVFCKAKDFIEQLNKEVNAITETHARQTRNILDNLPKWLLEQLERIVGDLANASAEKIQEALGSLIGKRDLSQHKRILDTLAQIGQGIADFFKPHVDKIVDGVKQIGESIKNAAGNALETVKGHVNTLGEKLKGHVEELKNHGEKILGHGSNALNALKDAVGDIINQTLGNVSENIKGIIDTGKDAGKVIGEHIGGES